MDPDDIKHVRDILWDLENTENLDREGVEEIIKLIRGLLNAYLGATRNLFKLRSKGREGHHE